MRWAVAWVPLVFIMIINGVAREKLYGPRLTELQAHQASTVTAAVLYALYVWLLFGFLRLETAMDAWRLGLVWLGLTVAFEFAFGRYVAGHTWSRLLADYDLRAGRVWSLFLAWVLVAPRIVFALQAA